MHTYTGKRGGGEKQGGEGRESSSCRVRAAESETAF